MRLLLVTLLAAAASASLAPGRAAPSSSCAANGYAYAGLAATSPARGVFAVVKALETPSVRAGHVAGWVGVGGEGYGPDGSNVWLQAGISAFADGSTELYYELALPGQKPRYTRIRGVAPGEAVRVSVVSQRTLPGWWDVRVDGVAVSELVYLPGSESGWEPIATAETWGGALRACNGFAYQFESLRVAEGSSQWTPFRGSVLEDPGYKVLRRGSGFIAKRL